MGWDAIGWYGMGWNEGDMYALGTTTRTRIFSRITASQADQHMKTSTLTPPHPT